MDDRVEAHPRSVAGPRRGPAVRSWRGLLVALAVCSVAVVAVRGLLVQSFVVPTGSMAPTVEAGDRVLVWRPPHFTGSLRRGDVVVFDGRGVFDPPAAAPRTPLAGLGRSLAAAAGMPVGRRDYVKRVVGLPGERVACCDAQGRVTVDGRPLDEPYLPADEVPSREPFQADVPDAHLWVMGDSRSESADSRSHLGDPGGGSVPQSQVVGTVVAVWWPPGRTSGVNP